jgi:hypothetical protein
MYSMKKQVCNPDVLITLVVCLGHTPFLPFTRREYTGAGMKWVATPVAGLSEECTVVHLRTTLRGLMHTVDYTHGQEVSILCEITDRIPSHVLEPEGCRSYSMANVTSLGTSMTKGNTAAAIYRHLPGYQFILISNIPTVLCDT